MKTSIDIAEPLLKRARDEARRRGITFRELVESSISDHLERSKVARTFKIKPSTATGSALIDLSDWDAVLDIIYEPKPLYKDSR